MWIPCTCPDLFCHKVDLTFALQVPLGPQRIGDMQVTSHCIYFMHAARHVLNPLLSQSGTTGDSGMEDAGASQLAVRAEAPLQKRSPCNSLQAYSVTSAAPLSAHAARIGLHFCCAQRPVFRRQCFQQSLYRGLGSTSSKNSSFFRLLNSGSHYRSTKGSMMKPPGQR